jgi:hypothetical protein
MGCRLSNAPGPHFFATQNMSQMELNKCKVGKKHHYFLKVGGYLIYAQPFKQYLEEAFLTKPNHSVRGASCDFLMDVAELIDNYGISSDEGMLRAANLLQDLEINKELPEDNTPIMNEQQNDAIVMHRNSKYVKLDADKFPVLAILNIRNSDVFVTLHYFDGMLTELVDLLGKQNRCIDYKNYKN